MQQKSKIRLGDLLVQNGLINDEQLQSALAEQRKTGRKLGASLIAMGLVTEQNLIQLLSEHLGVKAVDINEYRVNQNAVRLLPEIHARRYRAIVIDDTGERLLVAMTDPADINAVDELSAKLPKPLDIAVISESQLFIAYESFYRKTEEIATFATELADEYNDDVEFQLDGNLDDDQDNLVAKLLQSIFEDAVLAKASDIHIEPCDKQLRIRQRVDGVLQENLIPQNNIAAALVLRLKLMSGLDISEKRLPQDGRTHVKVKNRDIDIRVSTMPTQNGESVVLRLLDQSQGILSLEQTGMPAAMTKRFRSLLSRPHGMVLVTGPTGSGKTTTLYGSLNELNKPETKIITVEDPVEYRLPRINQVQVNTKINLTFASILRTTLRQDPDILMVGEMRDQETVEIGLRGALTGHLVLSTLHTNDAISSAIRLIDMGAPGYLVASSLKGIVAQRLIRKLCERCVQTAPASGDHAVWLSTIDKDLAHNDFKHPGGCQACNYTGYKGRIGVFELLEMNEAMMNALKDNDAREFNKQAVQSEGYRPLAMAALDYAKEGLTSLNEVLKLVEMVNDTSSGYQSKSSASANPVKDSSINHSHNKVPIANEQPINGGLSLEDN